MNGTLRELEVAVSVCASFEDVLAAERVLSDAVGPRVRLRSFQAGTAVLLIRVPEGNAARALDLVRAACGRLFSVSETRRGRIELWSRDPVAPVAMASQEPAAAQRRPSRLPGHLPVRGLTPG